MPLKLKGPRPGKTPYYSVRGTYLGVHVDKSLGTDKRPVAVRLVAEIEGKIERREYPAPAPRPDRPTFLSAAVAYMEAGGSRRYVSHLIKHFGETPLDDINQAAIDAAAIVLHPSVTPATRNVYVYTPVSAILHHAIPDWGTLRRPKGAKGQVRTDHVNPTDAAAIIAAANPSTSNSPCYCASSSTPVAVLAKLWPSPGPSWSMAQRISPRRRTMTRARYYCATTSTSFWRPAGSPRGACSGSGRADTSKTCSNAARSPYAACRPRQDGRKGRSADWRPIASPS